VVAESVTRYCSRSTSACIALALFIFLTPVCLASCHDAQSPPGLIRTVALDPGDQSNRLAVDKSGSVWLAGGSIRHSLSVVDSSGRERSIEMRRDLQTIDVSAFGDAPSFTATSSSGDAVLIEVASGRMPTFRRISNTQVSLEGIVRSHGGSIVAADSDGRILLVIGGKVEVVANLGPRYDPTWIAAGPEDDYWFTMPHAGSIARLDSHRRLKIFGLPRRECYPEGIAVSESDTAWFSEQACSSVDRLSRSGDLKRFATPSANSEPYDVAVESNGTVWFTEAAADRIGRITPAGNVDEFKNVASPGRPAGIVADADGRIWYLSQAISADIGPVWSSPTLVQFTPTN
jgi:streptogramin lyase